LFILVDNCTAHPKEFDLSNVTVEFFPATCTSRLQPLNLGVRKAIKERYRKMLVQHFIACNNTKALPLQGGTL
jgi:hypothetical protein